MARFSFIFSMTFILAGCATQAQREYLTIKTANQQAISQERACTAAVYDSVEFSPLRKHIPLSVRDVTLAQLSNTSVVTPEEINAIFLTHPMLEECRKQALATLSQTGPSVVPIMTKAYNMNEDDLLGLIRQKISWGEYLRRVRDRATAAQAAVQAEEQQIVRQLRQENQAEVAQRERAAEALAGWWQTQELINAARRPVITNCSAFSGMVSCLSQ